VQVQSTWFVRNIRKPAVRNFIYANVAVVGNPGSTAQRSWLSQSPNSDGSTAPPNEAFIQQIIQRTTLDSVEAFIHDVDLPRP
jgi:hypothetical protein